MQCARTSDGVRINQTKCHLKNMNMQDHRASACGGFEPFRGLWTELTRSKITNYVQAAVRANTASLQREGIFSGCKASLNELAKY